MWTRRDIDLTSLVTASSTDIQVRFRHNDPADLGRVLRHVGCEAGKMVVVDGVFSMEGSIVKLPEIVQLCKAYDAVLVVDDAHSVGVLGDNGRGTAEHFDLEHSVDIVMGTFSKSFASMGGFIATDLQTIDFIKHHSRPLIFSASMAPATVATESTICARRITVRLRPKIA